MKCEFEYCIYNLENKCLVRGDGIINSLGMCDNCIIVSIDKDYLDKEKGGQFNTIEEDGWDNWS